MLAFLPLELLHKVEVPNFSTHTQLVGDRDVHPYLHLQLRPPGLCPQLAARVRLEKYLLELASLASTDLFAPYRSLNGYSLKYKIQ